MRGKPGRKGRKECQNWTRVGRNSSKLLVAVAAAAVTKFHVCLHTCLGENSGGGGGEVYMNAYV